MYQETGFYIIEEVFLAVTSILTTVMIFMSHNPFSQKAAALTFIFLPLIEYAMLGGSFGEAAQYSIILMSLIIMYCVISNVKSRKLAATETELNMATEIQTSMLPSDFPAFPDRAEFDIYASMDPAKEVGGDFYDFFMIDDDHLAIVIADVSGKGVPAALFMMSSKIYISDHATMGGSPAEILERVNKLVYANNDANMFVTVWLGILEISTGKLISSSAGHEYPMINQNGKYEILKDKHGLAVGAIGMSKYVNTEIQLKKGDSIFVYTDGVAEATDANNELFGTDRTLEALNAVSKSASQKDILEGVRAAVDAFVKEAPQFDDLTMVGLRYYGPQENTAAEGQ
jgi:serine phosphatase RsbU (regulator of sigma subunit)